MIPYEYIRKNYGINPIVGQRVTHHVTKKSGVITRESKSHGHYVQVRFDGLKFSMNCHPTELTYHDEQSGAA